MESAGKNMISVHVAPNILRKNYAKYLVVTAKCVTFAYKLSNKLWTS